LIFPEKWDDDQTQRTYFCRGIETSAPKIPIHSDLALYGDLATTEIGGLSKTKGSVNTYQQVKGIAAENGLSGTV